MNYTIIGHSEDNSYHDRCGDYIRDPGKFDVQFFREDEKEKFLKAWAHARFHNTYETFVILLNGVPDDKLSDEEYDTYQALEGEREAFDAIVKAEHEEAERVRKEAAANAAVEKARKIAADQRARDLAQLAELQRKLGLS